MTERKGREERSRYRRMKKMKKEGERESEGGG